MINSSKITILGAVRLAGKSSKTGRDYDMSRITLLVPSQVSGPVVSCAGYDTVQVDCTPDVVAQLASAQLDYPYQAEAQMGIDRRGKSVVMGIDI